VFFIGFVPKPPPKKKKKKKKKKKNYTAKQGEVIDSRAGHAWNIFFC
jgi:hypothetical protein